MRVGVVILPELRAAALRTIWRRAEQLGFAHGWTYDHLAWRSLRDAPWFAAVPTLAAAALATRRLRLGILVASPNFRHPVPFARELIALDDLSGGRFTLGIGAGAGLGCKHPRPGAVVDARAGRPLRRVRLPHRPAAAPAGDVVLRPFLLSERGP
jgi:hypothetical protein